LESSTASFVASPASMESRTGIAWYCYAVLFGATSIVIGVLWDISWHQTIGRDTFWTSAHLAIYLGGVLGGMSCGWLVLKTTFKGSVEERAASVRFWGFRGPLGAWLCIWGAIAMVTSAPLDNWWHNAYGLDVRILSPPHTVLALGMYAIALGALLLVLARQNNAAIQEQKTGSGLFIYVGGILLVMVATFLTEYSFPNRQHTALFYQVSCGLYPSILAAVGRAAKLRWPATLSAAIYLLIVSVMIWILPLFSATPKLAPIYNPVDHMVPPPFPLLLIVPALAIDLLIRWIKPAEGWRGWFKDWLLALLTGTAFFGVFLAVQWHFAKFILSPAANNWFFAGGRYWSYGARPGAWQNNFWENESWLNNPVTIKGLALALVLAILSARLGLGRGRWMAKVRR